MILNKYILRNFFKSMFMCVAISFSIFFIFSLLGYLSEKNTFNIILKLSFLNSLQIFSYTPSHIFILSICVSTFNLKSKNELTIIKEYIQLKDLFILFFPILIIFVFIDLNKQSFSSAIEESKSSLINKKYANDFKVIIENKKNIKTYSVFLNKNEVNGLIDQYLKYQINGKKIENGVFSTNLKIKNDNLYINGSTIYKNNKFYNDSSSEILFQNFSNFWMNKSKIINDQNSNKNTLYLNLYSIFFYILFYFCVSMIFFSKNLLKRSINIYKIFFLILFIFLYYLIVPKMNLNNFQFYFHIISLLIFLLIFLKIKKYE